MERHETAQYRPRVTPERDRHGVEQIAADARLAALEQALMVNPVFLAAFDCAAAEARAQGFDFELRPEPTS